MSPTHLLRTTTLLITLTLPLSANALMLKVPRKAARDTNQLQYASSSSRRNVLTSTSSTPYLATIRSKDTGMSFKMPDNWKPLYTREGVSFRMDRGNVSPYQTSFLSVTRKKLTKTQSIPLLYRTFLNKATIDAAGMNLGGPDFYIPSFQLTGSGTIDVQGTKALSLSYTGESRSEQRVYRRVDVVKGTWQYTIWLSTVPGYEKEDRKVFEGVVGSWSTEK